MKQTDHLNMVTCSQYAVQQISMCGEQKCILMQPSARR